MDQRPGRVLLIGYGNPGRRDDGLGPALVERLAGLELAGVTLDADYQLNVEHAAQIAAHDAVIFVDAALSGPEPLFFRRIEPRAETSFTTHSVEPAAVLGLAAELFGSRAAGFALGIRGYEFDVFDESLSPAAAANLEAALEFIVPLLKAGDLAAAAQDN